MLKIFQTDQIERKYFTSRVWWALSEEIAQRAEEMACEKETASCVRGYHVYKDQQLGKCWCVARSQPTRKNIRVKYFRTFSVSVNIFATNKKRITVILN